MPKLAARSPPHRLDIAIGQRIRERRRSLGMSQVALADAVGVTFQQIQKYERGTNRISFSRLIEITGALCCQLSDLSEGLHTATSVDELNNLNGLLAMAGALEMLEAYAAIPSQELRRAVLQHAKALAATMPADVSRPRGRSP